MNFIDLFAGVGGFRLGLEMAGHGCKGYVEIDKFARKSYEAIHQTEGEWTAHDITRVTDDDIRQLKSNFGPIHIIAGGFPCQAFSVAGKRLGFEDTRGTLFFEIMRFARILEPKYLFLENVRGLLNHNKGDTFEVIIRTMDELGYDTEWQVLNSKDFGVPQNRERVFIIGHLRGERTRKVFPIPTGNGETLKQVVGGSQGQRVYDSGGVSCTLSSQGGGQGAKTGLYMVNVSQKTGVRHTENSACLDANYFKSLGCNQQRTGVLEVRPCLTPAREEKRQNGRRFKEPGEPMFTLTSQDIHGVAYRIKDGTVKGYTDFIPTTTTIDLSVPSSTTRRGRVKDGVTPTLDTGCQVGVFTRISSSIKPSVAKNFAREYQDIVNSDKEIYQCQCESGWQDNKIGIKISPTLRANNNHTSVLDNDYRIRKLTPRECFRLQGFPDWAFDKAAEVNSDSQLYKQAGNSVTVNVIYEIARRLM